MPGLNTSVLQHGHAAPWSPLCFASAGSFCRLQRPLECWRALWPGQLAQPVPLAVLRNPLEPLICWHLAFPASLPFPTAGCGAGHGPHCPSPWGFSRQPWPLACHPAPAAPAAATPPQTASFWIIGAIILCLNLGVTGRSGQWEEGSSSRQGVSDRP